MVFVARRMVGIGAVGRLRRLSRRGAAIHEIKARFHVEHRHPALRHGEVVGTVVIPGFRVGIGRGHAPLHRKHAGETWRHVAAQLRARWPKLADLMDASEHDVLAYMAFPRQHRTKLHSTNPIERLNKEVKRRADVVGIFPNEASIMRLIGAVLFEQNDEWQTSSRYMMVEAFAQIDKEEIDPILSITTKAA